MATEILRCAQNDSTWFHRNLELLQTGYHDVPSGHRPGRVRRNAGPWRQMAHKPPKTVDQSALVWDNALRPCDVSPEETPCHQLPLKRP